jgi:hypothetical protein
MEKLKAVIAGCHLIQSLLSSHHAQNVSKHTNTYFFLFCTGVKLVSHVERRTLTEGIRKQGAEENISICEGGSNRPSQKTI